MESRSNAPAVLVVEEETHQREAIVSHLEAAGFSALGVESTDEALGLLRARTILALVTDAHLPGPMDGFELAQTARERFADLPVVMMSGHSDASSGALPEGAAFVAKPYLLEHLVPTLRRMTGVR
ncbi:response regulator [Salinarimonas soli]|nr:response regulator [Salinarimonas soli]